MDGPDGSTAAVHICIRVERVELRFGPGFTAADVGAVRDVPSRKWHREQRMWVLPETLATQRALERSFGRRLVRSAGSAPADGPGTHSDGPYPAGTRGWHSCAVSAGERVGEWAAGDHPGYCAENGQVLWNQP